METFLASDFIEQNLLCELYLHVMTFPLDRYSNPTHFLGDVQLRDFSSFVSNHVQWERSFQNFLIMSPTLTFGFEVNLNPLVFSLLSSSVGSHVPSKLSK